MKGGFAVILTLDNILKAMGYKPSGTPYGTPIFRIKEKLDQTEFEGIVDKKIGELHEKDVDRFKYCDEHPVEDSDIFKKRIDEIFIKDSVQQTAQMSAKMMLFFMLGGYLRFTMISPPDSSIMSKGGINRCPKRKIKQFADDLKHMKYLPNAPDNSGFVNDEKERIPTH